MLKLHCRLKVPKSTVALIRGPVLKNTLPSVTFANGIETVCTAAVWMLALPVTRMLVSLQLLPPVLLLFHKVQY